jgi:protein Tex
MQNKLIQFIAQQINCLPKHAAAAIQLFDDGATVPFIARYRKHLTGGMEDVNLHAMQDLIQHFRQLEKRREFILKAIASQNKLTPQLKLLIEEATDLQTLEDLYLPYKKDKKTRADVAIENGLAPLADIIIKQKEFDIVYRAKDFVKGKIKNAEEALQGARDILAERMNEDVSTRNVLRELFKEKAFVSSKVKRKKETEGIKYQDYFNYSEPAKRMSAHRVLALLRGEKEGFLNVSVAPDWEPVGVALEKKYVYKHNACGKQMLLVIADSWKRLLQPSLESEWKQLLKTKADEASIEVFAENLKQLLLGAPLGQKKVLAIDPGFRTGCKMAALDDTGNVVYHGLFYLHEEADKNSKLLNEIQNKYSIEAIAVGSGTAGRETESFLKQMTWKTSKPEIYLVNEDGASVYSASEVARTEFPNYDVTVRGAISIGRRLMDPLAELVKIDPKSIGVGQYQHDVNQTRLKEQLDRVVINCVNKVGVNVNTASPHLLQHVSGLGPVLAENIVQFRNENGNFKSREQFKKVPRMGAKSFEQCAGFLRIQEGENPLDNSAVHPESYGLIQKLSKSVGLQTKDLVANKKAIAQIDLSAFANETIGITGIEEILKELAQPGLDPRKNLIAFEFDQRVKTPEDLIVGMKLPGLVSNLTAFGAFVNLGVKQDGLLHISQITDKFITSPAEVLHLGQQVMVRVVEIDLVRKRISLSLKEM